MAENNATIKPGEHSHSHSIPQDRLTSSSVSSASSAKSASSRLLIRRSLHNLTRTENKLERSNSDFDGQTIMSLLSAGSFAIKSSKNAAPLETPPAQTMERPDTLNYRIPSHVFASKSPNGEWSTASSESLFSIHTGNASFTRDQFNWLLKSGELGLYGGPGGDIRKSGELPPPSPKPVEKEKVSGLVPDKQKSGEEIIANQFKTSSASTPANVVSKPADVGGGGSDGGASNSSVNMKQDDLKVELKVDTKKKERSCASDEVPPTTSSSHQSETSCQSFAFPVLAEIEIDKSANSVHSRADNKKNSKTGDQDGPKTPTSTSPPTSTTSSWFSCFTRCSCC